MKKILILSMLVAWLAGCSSPQIGWGQDESITVDGADVQLTSNLWLNKMPTIGELQLQNVHGALYLESTQPLAADMEITSISIRQGEQVWLIEGDAIEVRTHDENQWELVFAQPLAVDNEQPVDVAVQLSHQQQTQWMVEKNVAIDTVY